MEESQQTWRDLLGKVTAEPQERQRVADAIGVNPITLTRWIAGKSNPRQDNLRPLLDALPQYRQQFIELISQEFPHFFIHSGRTEDLLQNIPSAFYARVLNAHTSSPAQLRASSACILILQQILGHLDPQRLGLGVTVIQCVTPREGLKVRSLRRTVSRGTAFPEFDREGRTQFLGAESQSGQAVIRGYPVIIQNKEEKLRIFPTHYTGREESSVVYPILLNDRVAGCLYLSSTQPNYFSQVHQDLIQNYVDLMVLAFEPHEFYDFNMIELGILPDYTVQQKYIARFHQKVTQHLIDAAQQQQALTRPMAEHMVWQEIEDELLYISLHGQQ